MEWLDIPYPESKNIDFEISHKKFFTFNTASGWIWYKNLNIPTFKVQCSNSNDLKNQISARMVGFR